MNPSTIKGTALSLIARLRIPALQWKCKRQAGRTPKAAVWCLRGPTALDQGLFQLGLKQQAYMRLVRNVKKVLPMAKEVRQIIIETAEFTETLPPSERKAHLKRVEASIVKEYKPRMKKLTFSQGKLLIKLVDRECHSTAYEAMQAFIGPVRSGMWQAFAWMFGASLKKGYDPDGVDRLTERVVLMVEAGQI